MNKTESIIYKNKHMKKRKNLIVIFLFFGLLVSLSCTDDDDATPPEEPQGLLPDSVALKALYDANTTTTIDWDFDHISMKNWNGTALTNKNEKNRF